MREHRAASTLRRKCFWVRSLEPTRGREPALRLHSATTAARAFRVGASRRYCRFAGAALCADFTSTTITCGSPESISHECSIPSPAQSTDPGV